MDPSGNREESAAELQRAFDQTLKRHKEAQKEIIAVTEMFNKAALKNQEEAKKEEEELKMKQEEEAAKQRAEAAEKVGKRKKSMLEEAADLLEVATHDPSGFRTTVKVLGMVGEAMGDAFKGAKSKAGEVVDNVMDRFVGKNEEEGKAGDGLEGVKKDVEKKD